MPLKLVIKVAISEGLQSRPLYKFRIEVYNPPSTNGQPNFVEMKVVILPGATLSELLCQAYRGSCWDRVYEAASLHPIYNPAYDYEIWTTTEGGHDLL